MPEFFRRNRLSQQYESIVNLKTVENGVIQVEGITRQQISQHLSDPEIKEKFIQLEMIHQPEEYEQFVNELTPIEFAVINRYYLHRILKSIKIVTNIRKL